MALGRPGKLVAFIPAALALLRATARAGHPCPTDDAFAARISLGSSSRVSPLLARMEAAGMIRRLPRQKGAGRVVEAADGTWRTAPYQREARGARSGSGSPEAALAAAKVLLMWEDLEKPIVRHNSSCETVTAAERAQAEAFLFATAGEGRAAREYWCIAAGIDPDALRDRALRRRNAGGDAAAKVSAVAHVAAGGRAAATARPAMGVSSRNSAGRGQPRPATLSGDAR